MEKTNNLSVFVLFALLLCFGAAAIYVRPPAPQWRAVVDTPQPFASVTAPEFTATLLPQAAASSHSSSVVVLRDGTRLAAWFAGSREGAGDVALVLSRQEHGLWSPPKAIQTVAGVSRAWRQYVKKIGNPVLFVAPNADVHLVFVTVALGGWAGSRIAHSVSSDGGIHWSAAQLWITSPFTNVSTLVRNPPLPIQINHSREQGWLLPVYHEFLHKFPEWIVLGQDGNMLAAAHIPVGHGLIQPALIAFPDQSLRAYFRAANRQQHVMAATYRDGWQDVAHPLALQNPDAAVAVVRLSDGRLLMAYNPSMGNRNRMALALSEDGGHWTHVVDLEQGEAAAEFSYPALAVSGDSIDMTYTYLRQTIKHVRFNIAWLNAKQNAPKPSRP